MIVKNNNILNGILIINNKRCDLNSNPPINTQNIDDTASNDIISNKQNDNLYIDLKSSIKDNFANEINNRFISNYTKNDISSKILADSLILTADSIDQIAGKEQANAFMSIILASTDGIIEENKLISSINLFFNNLTTEISEKQQSEIMDILNFNLDTIFSNDDYLKSQVDAGIKFGLAFALNYFFDKEPIFIGTNKQIAETNGFNFNLAFDNINIVKQNNNGECVIKINTGQSITASELIGSEIINTTIQYLRDELFNENAALYLENLANGANVMNALATTISIINNNNGQVVAQEYINFLNKTVAPAISSISNSLSFDAWTLGLDYSKKIELSPVRGDNLKIGDSKMHEILRSKGHQGLLLNWTDYSSGAKIEREIDLTDLYDQYNNGTVTKPNSNGIGYVISFQNLSGNLVNAII
jgi:hypothetical protein